jgi:hypothetical protein
LLTKDIYERTYELMRRNKNCCIATVFFGFGVMTDMVSPYLERPVRTLDRVLEDRVHEDRALVRPDPPCPASAAPVGSPVGSPVDSNPDLDPRRLDPIGVLVRLLMSGHGAATAEAPAAPQPNGRRAA